MSIIPRGPGGGGKPYKGDNPIVPTTTDLTIDKGTLITKPLIISAVEDVTPEVTAQTPLVTEILESLVGKATLANATPETILEGYSAYVGQQLVEGTLEDRSRYIDMMKICGFRQMAVDTFTYQATTKITDVVLSHSLGEVPKFVMIIGDNFYTAASSEVVFGFALNYSNQATFLGATYIQTGYNLQPTSTEISYTSQYSAKNFAAGVTYTLITFA